MKEDMIDNKAEELRGSGGGKGGGGSARVAQEAPNTLQSSSTAKIIDLISEGEIEGLANGLQSVYFDGTPLQNEDGSYNFSGVNITTRDGTPDQSHIAGFPSVENTTSVGVQVTAGNPIVRTIDNLDADAVRATVNIPALTKQDTSTGDLNGYHVEIAFDISANGGSFTEVKRDRIEGKTTSPYQRSYRLPLNGTGPWEIRMRRITEDAPDSSIRNDTFFSAFTEIIDSKLSYPDSALVAVEVEAQQFGSSIPSRAYDVKLKRVKVPSNYDPVNRTYDGIWDGTFKISWTDNPAWCFLDLATSERYGAGLQNVSKWDLYTISQYCDEMVPDGFGGQEPRFTFNAFIQSRSEAIEVLNNLVSVFRGMIYWGQNTTVVTHDATPAGGVSRTFSPSNVVEGNFNYSGSALRERHSVALVSWNDPDDDYRLQVEVVEDADAIQEFGWRQKDVTAFGCTSRGQAHRVGKWILDSERNETDVVSFTVGMEDADIRPGELILVSDPTYVGMRLSGRVKNAGLSSVEVDNIPSDIGSYDWDFIVRLPDGTLEIKSVESFSHTTNTVNIVGGFTQTPVENTVWMLAASQASPRYFRVLMVSEEEEGHTYKVEALEHDPTKYDRVEQGIHLEAPDYTTIPTGAIGAPFNLSAEPFTYRAGDNEHMGLTVSWSPSDDARVMRYLGEAQGPNDVRWVTHHTDRGTSFDIRDVEAGEWQFRVRALTGTGVPSSWITMTTTIGQLLEPSMPQSVTVDAKTFTIMLDPHGFYPNQQYEYWRSTVALTESEIESNAVLVGIGSQITDTELTPLTDYYYYIRGINSYGVSDWYPVQATTEKNPDVIMDIITGEIQQGDLWPGLQEEIEQIRINESNITVNQDQITQTQNDLDQTKTDLSNTQAELESEADRLDSRINENRDNLASEANRLNNRVNNVSNNLDTVRNDLEAADADLEARMTDAENNIVNEQEIREHEDEMIINDLEGIQILSENNDARIASLNRIIEEQNELEAIQFESINVETANRKASIRTEEQVRTEEDFALAQRTDSLEASVNDNAAAITTEQQARVDGDNILSSQIGELSAKVDALPQFASGFESGSDFDQWNVSSGETLTADTSDPYAGLQSGLITDTNTSPNPYGGGGVNAQIPSGATEAFEGFEIRVRVAAKQPSSNASSEFAVAYSTASVGNSGWQYFTPTSTWQIFEFTYTVPEGSLSSNDVIHIWGDTSGSGLGVLVDGVNVQRVAGEIQEITAALQEEQQARIDGDEALTTQLNNLETTVGDNTSAITTEQTTRANADDALAQDISNLRVDVDDNSVAITNEQTARVNADDALLQQIEDTQVIVGENQTNIQQEQTARVNADEALSDRLDAVEVISGDNQAAITEESSVRASEDEALALSIDRLETSSDDQSASIDAIQRIQQEAGELEAIQFESINVESANRKASIRTEEQVRVEEDSVLAQRSSSLETRMDDAEANIVSEETARINEDNALASSISTLEATVNDNTTAITNEQTARVNADDALAQDITALQTEVGDNSSAIASEQQARVDADDALASDISTLQTDVGNNSSAITNEQTARVNADDALASDITSLESRVDDNQAAIQSEASARADADTAQAERTDTLYARVDRMAVWTSSFELGDDRNRWTDGESTSILDTTDPHSGSNCVRIHSSRTDADPWNGNHAASAVIPAATQAMFAGKRIRVSVFARQYDSNPAPQFAISYSTNSAGNSGWNHFTDILLGTWKKYSFYYDVPEGAEGNGQILIWGDSSGSTAGRATVFDDLSIELVTGADEIPEIGANQAAIQNEQTARIDADDALAQDITTVQTNLNGEISSVEQTMQSQIDDTTGRIEAMYAIRTDVNGYVSGIGLANDGQESEVAMRTDRFYIAQPGVSNSEVVPFIVDNGVTYLDEAMVKDLTFTKLRDGSGNFLVQDGQIQAEHLQLNDALEVSGGAGEIVGKRSWEDGRQGLWNSSTSHVVDINPRNMGFPVPYSKGLQIEDRVTTEGDDTTDTPCSPGDTFNVYAIINANGANGPASAGVRFMDSSGSTTGWNHVSLTTGTNWEEVSGTVTAPANTVKARPYLLIDAPYGSAGYARVAYVSIREADEGVTRVTSSGIQIYRPNGNKAVDLSPQGMVMESEDGRGRTRVDDNGVRVYDDTGQLRVRLGLW